MRLLLITQMVDSEDLYLGFFTRWIEELAPYFESVEVICLKEGVHRLPANVQVHSLGKERGTHFLSRLSYIVRFFLLVWRLRSRYDSVLVHMNQEYILLAGWLWRAFGKPIYMWRNHYAGSWLTTIAIGFCTKVFCTSKHSYTARFKKTVFMPVGVDTARFFADDTVGTAGSILFFARMAPSKNPFQLLGALRALKQQSIPFTATFAGSALPEHEAYYQDLVARAGQYGLSDRVVFVPGVPNDVAPALYRSHEIFVNCARSGMLDKMIFEAAASGCIVLASSKDFAEEAGQQTFFENEQELTNRLAACLSGPKDSGLKARLAAIAQKHSLHATMERLALEIV